ncbi:MAG: MerR family transcriptional regulator, partial [Anaerolineae bacterium]|nr:MerR family transcriptional regulator [Anaerolineae bacterium]
LVYSISDVGDEKESKSFMSGSSYFSIGAFAKRADVTVRTLRYYDQIGLLSPSDHTESGRRLYTDMDYARLQQILTLKLIGLSLEEIRSLLTTDQVEIGDLLQRQKQVLGQQVRQLQQVIRAIEQAQRALDGTPTWDTDQFLHIIKAVMMNNQVNWFDQFFTDTQQNQLAEIGQQRSWGDEKDMAEAWKKLFSDIREHLEQGGDDSTAPSLVRRWDDLMAQFAGGNPGLAQQLNQAYIHLANLPGLDDTPQAVQDWLTAIQEAAAFIQRAR